MAVARNCGHRDGPYDLSAAEPYRDRVSRTELVVALRIGLERAVHVGAGVSGSREDRQAEVEGILQRIGRETLRPQSREVIAGPHPQLAEPGPEDKHDVGLGARPPDANRAFCVHPWPMATQGGALDAQPFPDDGRVGVDHQPAGIAGGLRPEHEAAGGFVEVGVACRVGQGVPFLGVCRGVDGNGEDERDGYGSQRSRFDAHDTPCCGKSFPGLSVIPRTPTASFSHGRCRTVPLSPHRRPQHESVTQRPAVAIAEYVLERDARGRSEFHPPTQTIGAGVATGQ